MKNSYRILWFVFTVLCLLSQSAFSQQEPDPISAYYNRLKESKAKGGEETAFLSVGSDMMYALEYFEAKQYDSASWGFNAILKREPNNAYANFLYGVCIARLGREKEAKTYLEKAASLMPSLNDLAKAQISKLEVKEPKPLFDDQPEKTVVKPKAAQAQKPAAVVQKVGGKLVYGSYVCDYMQYQGNQIGGFGAAYKPVYKGYFLLKADGTYRWLDNGGTGKYRYDAKTGKITWLSGHLKTLNPIATIFTDGQKVAEIDVKFNDSYTWGCGCNK